jgi:4-amino-4-deoxy-L-arabinose transferase-like glycosyltransferase
LFLLSVSSAKRVRYLLPVIPAISAAIALWLEGTLYGHQARWERWWRNGGLLLAALLAMGSWGTGVYRAISEGTSTVTELIGYGVTAIAICILLRTGLRDTPRKQARSTVIMVLLAYAAFFTSPLFPLIESKRSYKGLQPFLQEHVPEGAQIHGHLLSERSLGAVAFYLNGTFPETHTDEELKNVLSSDTPQYVVISEEAYNTVCAREDLTNLADVIGSYIPRKHAIVLLRSRPPGK